MSFMKKLMIPNFFSELKSILSLAWPIILMNLFRFINPTISVIMCGHLTKLEFDAASLANSIINVFGVSIDLGFSTACDTLFAQIYGGKNRHKLGLMLQRASLVMTVLFFLLASVHLSIEPLLIFLQQDAVISRLTARYVALYLPGLFFDFHFLTISRYLQNQNIVYPMMISAIVGTIFNGVGQYVGLYVFEWGIDSSALFQAAGCMVMYFIQLVYVLWSQVYKPTWQGFEYYNALESWSIFFKLGIPGIIMIGVEEWTFEIGNFIAGALSATQLGAQSIGFQTEFFMYNIHVGLSIAAAIRCGQFIGGNQPQQASKTAKVVIITDLVISTITMTLILSLRSFIPYIFTSEREIVVIAEKILLVVAAIQIFDAGCSSTAGIFRACGLQRQGAIVMVMSYYIITVPLGLVLIYVVKMDIMGFWLALLCGLGLEVIVYMFLLARIDWQAQTENAKKNEKTFKFSAANDEEENLEIEETKPFIKNSMQSSTETSITKSSMQNLRHKMITHSHRRSLSGASDLIANWKTAKDATSSVLPYSSDTKKLIKNRLILVGTTAIIFIAALVIKFQLSPGLYTPCIPVNGSTTLSLDKHYPFCNDTIYIS